MRRISVFQLVQQVWVLPVLTPFVFTKKHQTCLTSREAHGTACSPVPLHPVMILLKYAALHDSCYTCDSPVHFLTPEITLTHHSLHSQSPCCTHTDCTLTGGWCQRGRREGKRRGEGWGVFSQGWGARRRPRALIFTSPTMSLCNW